MVVLPVIFFYMHKFRYLCNRILQNLTKKYIIRLYIDSVCKPVRGAIMLLHYIFFEMLASRHLLNEITQNLMHEILTLKK